MDVMTLMQYAAAKGVDFQYVAGVASRVDGAAKKRQLTRAEIKSRKADHLGTDVQDNARGRESKIYRHAAWSHAELGHGAFQLGELPWRAALHSFVGGNEHYWYLWQALASEAQRLARREHWPPRVLHEDRHEQIFFRERLAELVLDEERYKQLFTAKPQLYPIYMTVAPATWDDQLKGPFHSLQASYERWLSIARAMIRKRICGDE